MSLIQKYLAMEEHGDTPAVNVEVEVEVDVPEVQDVTEEEEYEAEEAINAQADIDHERQMELSQAESVAQETYAHLAGVARQQEILTHGIENAQYSPQFAASVSASLEEYRELFGDELNIASLENYGHKDLDVFYRESMEAFGDITKKLGEVVKAVSAKIARTRAAIGEDRNIADSLIKKIDASLNGVADLPDGKVSISLAGVKDRIAVNGVIKDDLSSGVKEHAASLQYLFGTLIPAELKFLEKAASGDVAEAMKATNPLVNAKTVNLLGGKATKEGDTYGYVSVKANDSAAKDIDVTKANLQKLLTELKKAVVVYKKSVADQGVLDKLARKLDKDIADNNREVSQDADAAEEFLKTIRIDNEATMELIIDASLGSRRSLIAVHQFADRAMKKLAKEGKKDD